MPEQGNNCPENHLSINNITTYIDVMVLSFTKITTLYLFSAFIISCSRYVHQNANHKRYIGVLML